MVAGSGTTPPGGGVPGSPGPITLAKTVPPGETGVHATLHPEDEAQVPKEEPQEEDGPAGRAASGAVPSASAPSKDRA
jgi:hypothetical protein